MRKKCEFCVQNVCYAWVCYSGEKCGAKDEKGNVVRMASIEEIKERERQLEKNAGLTSEEISPLRGKHIENMVLDEDKIITKADRRMHHKYKVR
jgi:hypothetical protein